MKTNKEQLMKHFATVLRNRALGKQVECAINQTIIRYLSRRELIEIIKKRFDGNIPKEHNLVEMENKELLELIGDEMFIISFVTEQWSKEISNEKPKPEKDKPSSNKVQKPKPENQKKP